MKEPLLIVFAADPVIPWPFIGIGIAVVLLVAIGIVFFVRSSGGQKKKEGQDSSSNWQPTGANAGAWNQQQGNWGQQGQSQQQGNWGQQQQGQGQGGWNAQPQAQSQSATQWGGQSQPDQGNWGNANPAQQQGGWNAQPQAQSQSSPQWGSQSQPDQGGWGAQPQAQAQSGNQWSGQPQQSQNQWEATAAAPSPQDAWGQQQQQPQMAAQQQQWGGSNPTSMPGAQPGYGSNTPSGQSWNQSQPQQDQWGAQAPAAAAQPGGYQAPNTGAPQPSWQQGGYSQPGIGGQFGADGDKTMLRPNPSAPQAGGLGYVQVKEGKEPGRIYEIRKESLSIGRSRESDIFLEDLAVSRLHASIVNLGNGNYALKDEGSANGTKVNDQLVNKFQTYPLQEGDRVQLGQTVLVFARR